MHDYARLNKLIKEIALSAVENSKPVNVMFGIVKSEDPLIIEIENKLPLNKNQLILSRNVTDFKTEYSFNNSDVKNNITIYNALKKDEGVMLIRLEGGQKFIVWDRKVSI